MITIEKMAYKMPAIVHLEKQQLLNLFVNYFIKGFFGMHNPISMLLFGYFFCPLITISKMATKCHLEK